MSSDLYCPVCGSSDPAKGCPECGVPCGDPFHGDYNVLPANLARELYESGRNFLVKMDEGLTKREREGTPVAETAAAAEIRFRTALARYEREVPDREEKR